MESILLIVQIVLAVAMIGMVLLQRSDADGFGMGSGSGMGLMSGRAKGSLMTRITAILAALFMLNSLVYSIIVARSSAVDLIENAAQAQKADAASGSAPDAAKKDGLSAPLADVAPKQEVPAATTAPSAAPVAAPAAPAAEVKVPAAEPAKADAEASKEAPKAAEKKDEKK